MIRQFRKIDDAMAGARRVIGMDNIYIVRSPSGFFLDTRKPANLPYAVMEPDGTFVDENTSPRFWSPFSFRQYKQTISRRPS